MFFPTNHKVFFYGYNKNLKIEIVDLSKFQINVSDRNINLKDNHKNINVKKQNLINAWLFGGLIVLTQGSAVAPFIYTIF